MSPSDTPSILGRDILDYRGILPAAKVNTEQNRYAVSAATVATATVRSFGISLKLALLIPLLMIVSAFCAQWILRFPPRSHGASWTAFTLGLGLVVELVALPIAATKLIRHRELRSRTNLALTLIPALLLLGRIVIAGVAGL